MNIYTHNYKTCFVSLFQGEIVSFVLQTQYLAQYIVCVFKKKKYRFSKRVSFILDFLSPFFSFFCLATGQYFQK